PAFCLDYNAGLHRRSCREDFVQERIRIFRRNAELLGSEGEGNVLHFRHRSNLSFHSGRAVGTVKVFNQIDFLNCRSGSVSLRTEGSLFRVVMRMDVVMTTATGAVMIFLLVVMLMTAA